MHVFQNTLVYRHVWLSDWCHLRRNDWCLCWVDRRSLLNIIIYWSWGLHIIVIIIVNSNHLIGGSWLFWLLIIVVYNLLSHSIVWILRSNRSLVHQIVGFVLSSWGSGTASIRWVWNIVWDHVPVVLINRIVLVAIRVDINFVELMINIRLEELLYHLSTVLSGQFLG